MAIETDTLTAKAIGIVVAVIVLGAVLVPVIDSVKDGGEEVDTGVVINDFQQIYNTDEYSSLQYFQKNVTSAPEEITLDMSYISSATSVVSEYTSVIYINMTDGTNCVVSKSEGKVIGGWPVYEGWPHSGSTVYEITSFNADIHSDWTVDITATINVTSVEGEDIALGEHTYSYSGEMESVGYFSKNPNGWISDNVGDFLKVADGSRIIMEWYCYPTEGEDFTMYDIIEINTSKIVDGKMQYALNVSNNGVDYGTANLELTFPSASEEGQYLVGILPDFWGYLIESNEDIPTDTGQAEIDCESWVSYVSVRNIDPSIDIESSDSGDSVTSTLLGIIPIFVILAILMGAVTLFYQGRSQ